MSISKLCDWSCVPIEKECIKYERYHLFGKAFIRLTPQPYRVQANELLNKWVHIAHTEEIDISISIFEDFASCSLLPEIETPLLHAITVITDGNYSFNTQDEISHAHNLSLRLFKSTLNSLFLNS